MSVGRGTPGGTGAAEREGEQAHVSSKSPKPVGDLLVISKHAACLKHASLQWKHIRFSTVGGHAVSMHLAKHP